MFDGKHLYTFSFTRLLVYTNYTLVTLVEYKQVMADDGTLLGPEMDYSEPNYILTEGLSPSGCGQFCQSVLY